VIQAEQAKRQTQLEKMITRLKKNSAEAERENAMFKDFAEGDF